MKRVVTKKWFLLVIIVVMAIVGVGVAHTVAQNEALAHQIASLQAETQNLTSKNSEFSEITKRFQSAAFLEREARTKFNLQKPGEQVIVFRADPNAASSTVVASDKEENNIDRWRDFFFPGGPS